MFVTNSVMIKQIAVRNFQSLASVTLDLGRITVIIGPTDSGKSAFLRAIEAAAFNVSAFGNVTHIPDQGLASKIAIAFKLDSGAAVLWEKTESSTVYRVLVPGQQELKFTKMGRSFLPEEVRKILGFHEITIDKNETARVQFANQHDSPFLVGDRGGVFASRVLGRLTGVHILSNAARSCKSDQDKTALKVAEEDVSVKRLRDELSQYDSLPSEKEKLLLLHKRLADLKTRQNVLRERKRLRDQWAAARLAREKIQFNQQLLLNIEMLEGKFRVLWSSLGALTKRRNLANLYHRFKDEFERSSTAIGGLKFIDVPLKSLEKRDKLLLLKASVVRVLNQKDELVKEHLNKSFELMLLDDQTVRLELEFPLCPFKDQFNTQAGVYRCNDLMKVIQAKS